MPETNELQNKIINGYEINKSEAMQLVKMSSGILAGIARNLQKKHNRNEFEFCSIINAKSGICSEDCRFCAQSGRYKTGAQVYKLLEKDIIVEKAILCSRKGVKRFSIVTSGKMPDEDEVSKLCGIIEQIRESADIGICASVGLITDRQYEKLRKSGVTRIHNNLETSERYFSEVCSTHSFGDKLRVIEKAKSHGFEICSGGIIGMGETFEDRIDLAFEVRKMRAVSMPVNILNPIKGTPFENMEVPGNEEIEKTVSLMKIINPEITIRMAGGRKQLPDKGKGCFMSGSNAAITGDMLTTTGISIDEDISIIKNLNYEMQQNMIIASAG